MQTADSHFKKPEDAYLNAKVVFFSCRLIPLNTAFYFLFLTHKEISVVLSRAGSYVRCWQWWGESSSSEGEWSIKTQPRLRELKHHPAPRIYRVDTWLHRHHKYVIGLTLRHQKCLTAKRLVSCTCVLYWKRR